MRRLLLLALLLMPFAALGQTHQVTLKWTEPTTSVPYGFNVYRVVQSGSACPAWGAPWALLQGSINSAAPTWVDTTISSGVTYCYAVTAYSTNGGGESAPSNLLSLPDPSAGGGGSTGAPPSPAGLTGTRQ